jgi:ribosomal RNA-processing protein 8
MKCSGVFHIAEVTSRLISNKEFIKLVESFGFHLEEHVRRTIPYKSDTDDILQTAPTTHFDLFRFTKTSFAPLGVVRGQTGWEARLAQGTKIMKGCVYKKR